MSILFNEKYKEARRLLRQAKNEHQLVLFIGSGTSLDSGMPSWKDAVEKIWEAVGSNSEQKPENLIVPQYYYNQRGKKEYTQLMRDIFKYKHSLKPTTIHNRILDFNTETIITTNYDNLIEQAAENKGIFLQVISQDKDLPYRKAGKELIKIHGDFEHDNYVLKEDDYLHYHSNFKLTENYIKSIIGVKTVLFLGYSLSDPDIKHIFSWVKEILSDEFQNAYMIEASKTYDENEENYYKHLGVNLIYASELLKDYNAEDVSVNLLRVVDYILEEDQYHEDYLDIIYDSAETYMPINYIYNRYIRDIIYKLDYRTTNLQKECLTLMPDKTNDLAVQDFLNKLYLYLRNDLESFEK